MAPGWLEDLAGLEFLSPIVSQDIPPTINTNMAAPVTTSEEERAKSPNSSLKPNVVEVQNEEDETMPFEILVSGSVPDSPLRPAVPDLAEPTAQQRDFAPPPASEAVITAISGKSAKPFADFDGILKRKRSLVSKHPLRKNTEVKLSVSRDCQNNSKLEYQHSSDPRPLINKTTALAKRTPEDVIADLRRTKPSSSSISADIRPKNMAPVAMQPKKISVDSVGSHSTSPSANAVMPTITQPTENENPEDSDVDQDDEDDEEKQNLPKAKRVTERRRRLNAIAKEYLKQNIQKTTRAILTKPKDETQQSTNWLIRQSQNSQIISSPREYQVELFERAKEKNTIAVLDTGSGKTLIAVLLLRHIFEQELEDRAIGKKKRISFFLVDSVPLVYQQHAVLKTNLDHEMDMFCGDMGCDLWSQKKWQKHFEKNMVIVCTADVLYQCLSHSFISIEQINLLIFDEAHHAKKNHSYAMIIKEFYAGLPAYTRLPKIFGMTASPVDSRRDVRRAAEELETLLHCEIATVADSSLMKHSFNTAKEEVQKYAILQPKCETPLYKEMYDRFKTNSIFKKPLIFTHDATRELGTWCADRVWPFCFSEEETKRLIAKTESKFLKKKIRQPLEILEKQKHQIEEARDAIKGHKLEAPDYRPLMTDSTNLSSKVLYLIHLLRERFERPTEDKCIVFVKQRYTARMLATLFAQNNIGTEHLRIAILVGARTGNAGDANFSFHEQAVTMMNFRRGAVNCLIATSVAEEGLDIPDCNLVIRFDLYTTVIQYIQSRGRARHTNSKYIHMIEEWNQAHIQLVREVRNNEGIMKRFCSELPEDRKLTGNDFNIDYFLAREKTQSYIIPETGAKLTYRTSLVVLATFVDSLHRGPNCDFQPEYIVSPHGKQFICEVILPQALDEDENEAPIRGAIGRPASTKQVAKCASAFEMCKLLRKGKYLDEYLRPKYVDQLPAMRNAQLAVDSKKREAYNMRTKPSIWSVLGVPTELYVTVLTLLNPKSLDREFQPLALLTRLPLPELPSFMLHFGAGKHSPVQFTSLSSPLKVAESMLHQINIFTLCIFDDVFSKAYAPDASCMPYFLLPVKSGASIKHDAEPSLLISWDVVQEVKEYGVLAEEKPWENHTWLDKPNEFFSDKFIVDPWDGSRKFWSAGVTHDYKPLDPVPPHTAPRPGTRKNNDNIMEYSCSLWAKARARRTFDEDQPVVESQLISLRRNLLDEFGTSEDETPKKCYLIMEPLKISPLTTTVVAMAYLFPAIIHRIESYIIALDACELLHLNVRPDLALEAVTKDSDNSGDHGEEQINFQRGMGNNYERLELLGDSFLKMTTSISLFGLHPDNDEFSYHVDRMLLICNKNLRDNALKLKLFEFIRSQSFNRRAWYPEGLVLTRGKTTKAPDTHALGDKTIADVCEAIIGAAYLTHYESGNMDPAVRAVTELVCSTNHNVTTWADYYKLYNKPAYQIARCTEAQFDLARKVEKEHQYHFNYPRLLRSAFIHPSYPYTYEHVPSYQRLEFLGDALLDMACVNHLFHTFPNRDPQWLTEHKMAMVSNQFLGALSVALGFHRHLLVFHSNLQKQIIEYATDITEACRQAEEEAIHAGKKASDCAPDYWTSVRQPPKCLPDIVEAYVGAVFVDSEYNYGEVVRFFNEHVLWFFKDMAVYDTFANKHPTTFLTNFLQTNMGCENWDISAHEVPGLDGRKPMVSSVVIIHDEVVASATAESGRYAKVAAAKNSLALLDGTSLPDFRAKYGCACKGWEEDNAASGKGGEEKVIVEHGTAV